MEKNMNPFLPIVLFIFIFCNSILSAENKPILNVYAPDYFASEWGPGPVIKSSFEKICNCELKYFTGDLLPRLRLEGNRTDADIVIGLDTDITKAARETGLFSNHNQDIRVLTLPIDWSDSVFLPFDWSYLAFVYNNKKIKNPPASFKELSSSTNNLKIIIQDPRTSISGLSLILWVKSIYGDQSKDIWKKLAPKIVTVTKGWSEAYGMFLEGEADMVLSYTTSPAYHLIAEGDNTKSAAIFKEGHYMTIELAGKIKNTKNPKLADQFMSFIMSNTFQNAIPTSNWSYPSALDPKKMPLEFRNLPRPKKSILMSEIDAYNIRTEAIEEWVEALSQ
jgi:thiamine transport system substrate-binding protein